MMTIYGIVTCLPDQMALWTAECWGACGKGIVGAVIVEEINGEIGVCRQTPETCPCFDKQLDFAIGDVNGDPLVIRKLKPRDK